MMLLLLYSEGEEGKGSESRPLREGRGKNEGGLGQSPEGELQWAFTSDVFFL